MPFAVMTAMWATYQAARRAAIEANDMEEVARLDKAIAAAADGLDRGLKEQRAQKLREINSWSAAIESAVIAYPGGE